MNVKRNKPRRGVSIRRRKYDGKFIRWELKTLSQLGILPVIEVEGKEVPGYDHSVWVITGVFNKRQEAFA